MNLNQFVAELAEQGVKLWVEDDQLRVRAAKGVLTPELRDLLALHKAELVKLLQKRNAIASDISIPLIRIERRRDIPLSFDQQRMCLISLTQLEYWVLAQLNPGIPLDYVPLTYHLTGLLNVTALEQASVEIVRRHEALRTTFAIVDGQVVQQIAQEPDLPFSVVDVREFSESKSEREVLAQRLAIQELNQPFDLAKGPLLRVKLLRLDEAEHLFILTAHHIVIDGSSFDVLLQELTVLYEAFCNSKPSPLPDLPIQYADFARWQWQWLVSKEGESKLDYWKQQLGGNLPVLQLPTDRPRSPLITRKGGRQSLILPKNLINALKILGQQENATLFASLLTAFKILLFLYTGQEDIIVAVPFANRQKPETKRLIGCFINMVPIRTYLGGNPSFRELLFRVTKVILAAVEHEEIPFPKLVEILRPKRDRSRPLLFQVMFDIVPLMQVWELSDVTGLYLGMELHTTPVFDWDIYLSQQTSETFILTWIYKTDLFDAATINCVTNQFLTLLESIVTNPDQQLAEFSLLFKQDNAEGPAINLQCQVDSYTPTAPSSSSDTVNFVPPRTPTEEAIAAIWCDVLELEQVGIHDNFFELGGNSLRSIQVISRLRDTFKVELPLRLLFEEPTVAALAQSIENLIFRSQKPPQQA